MKNDTSQKVKTGIFIIAGFVVLFLIIFLIGNQKNLFRSTIQLHVNYRTVSGLQEGNFVRYAGINVGSVDLIEILNDTTVRVDISLQSRMKKFIKTDSKASIGSDGLMGDKLVQIAPGSDKAPLIADNGELIAVNPFDMDKIMSKVEKVGSRIENIVGNIDTLSGNLANIFGKVNNGHGSLGKLINDDKMSNELQKTITSANKTVKTINKAASGVSDNMEAAKHNILFRGYFKKKEKKRIQDSIAQAKTAQKSDVKPTDKDEKKQKE